MDNRMDPSGLRTADWRFGDNIETEAEHLMKNLARNPEWRERILKRYCLNHWFKSYYGIRVDDRFLYVNDMKFDRRLVLEIGHALEDDPFRDIRPIPQPVAANGEKTSSTN